MVKSLCVLNPKTNRCITSNSENETSFNCKYEPITKRCSTLKKTRKQSTEKKDLFGFFGMNVPERKISNRTPPSPLRQTQKRVVKRKTPTLKTKQQKVVTYYNYLVETPVRTYLNKLIFKGSVSEMRRIARDMDLFIPLHEYPTDKKLREYLVNEVLDLAKNDARDSFKSNIITLENVKRVIKGDPELSALFMNDPEYAELFEKTPGGIHYKRKFLPFYF